MQCSGQNFSVFVKKMRKIIHVFGDFCANALFVCVLTMENCLFSCLTGLQPVLFDFFFEHESLLVICVYFSAKRWVFPIGTHTHSCRELVFHLKFIEDLT